MYIESGTSNTSDGLTYSERVSMRKMLWIFFPVFVAIECIPLATAAEKDFQSFWEQNRWDISIAAGILLMVSLLLWSIQLKWSINSKEFSFTYFPFVIKKRVFPISEIQSVEVMKINSLQEFGGWGLRWGKLGKAYTAWGNHILHVEFKDGKAINVSVLRPAQAREFLQTNFPEN